MSIRDSWMGTDPAATEARLREQVINDMNNPSVVTQGEPQPVMTQVTDAQGNIQYVTVVPPSPPPEPHMNASAFEVGSQDKADFVAFFDYVESEVRDGWGSGIEGYQPTFTARPSGLNMSGYGFDPRGGVSGPTTIMDYANFYGTREDADREQLNQLLYAAGWIDGTPEEARPAGGWHMPSQTYLNAFTDAARLAGENRMTVMELLRAQAADYQMRVNGRGRTTGPAGPRRPTVQLISEEDATALIDRVAQQEIGRKLTPDEANVVGSIVSAIQNQQRREQNALIDQQMAGGGAAESPTDVQTIATNEVEERFAVENQSMQFVDQYMQMMRGG